MTRKGPVKTLTAHKLLKKMLLGYNRNVISSPQHKHNFQP